VSVETRITPRQLAEMVELLDGGLMKWKPRGMQWFLHLGTDAQRAMASWNTRHANKPAFAHCTGNGYLHGCLFNEKLLAHRAVWCLATCHWPTATIDHINGDRQDNRICNLRDVAHVQNCRNQPRSKVNTSGFTGVSFEAARNKYAAHITIAGRTLHLGRFDALADANRARQQANTKYGFHKNHGRVSA
jgi:hypothetical protein